MHIISDDKDHSSYLSTQSIVCVIPKSYQEIKKRDNRIQWKKAIKNEIDSLFQNSTVSGVLSSKIIFIKMYLNIKHWWYYNKTFVPVATIRIIVSFAKQHRLLIHQIYVKTTFLNGLLKEDTRIPERVEAKKIMYMI